MFYQPGFVYVVLPLMLIAAVVAVIFYFTNRHSSSRAKMRWLLIIWCILVAGEIFKQIWYFYNKSLTYYVNYLPINISATAMYILPFILFSKKQGKMYQIAYNAACAVTLAIITTMFIYPQLLAGDLPANGNLFDSVQVFWSVVYHVLVSLIGFILIIFHPNIKFKWEYFCWTLVFELGWIIIMVGLSIALDTNFGMIVKGSFINSMPLWPHALIMSAVYLGGGVIALLLWKYLIIKYCRFPKINTVVAK